MPVATSVRFFDSTMPNAPVLDMTAGALISVLDACLVDGFDIKSVDALTISGGVATLTISSGHVFVPLDVIRIEGATPAELNADWRVVSALGSELTVDVSGSGIADGTATGTIVARRAPAGWSKPFSGTNSAMYRTAGVLPGRMDLRIDDANTQYARVKGYLEATSIDSGVGEFPAQAEFPGGTYIAKSITNTAKYWAIHADDKFFYLFIDSHSIGANKTGGSCFGLCVPLTPGGQETPFVGGQGTFSTNSTQSGPFSWPAVYFANNDIAWSHFNSVTASYVGLGLTGDAASVKAFKYAPAPNGVIGGGSASYSPTLNFPAPVNNAFMCQPVFCCHWNGDPYTPAELRAKMPGIYAPMHAAPLSNGALVSGVSSIVSGLLRLQHTRSRGLGTSGSSVSADIQACAAFDPVGPWR